MLAAKVPAATFLSILFTCSFEDEPSMPSGTTSDPSSGVTTNQSSAGSFPATTSADSSSTEGSTEFDSNGSCTRADCTGPTPDVRIVQASGNQTGTCALDSQGQVYCWGRNSVGQLGQGHSTSFDPSMPANTAGPVPLGQPATMIASGQHHNCALLQDASVICWGDGFGGVLGRGNTNHIGNNETPGQLPSIRIGAKVRSIHAGWNQSCAISVDDTLHCWGVNDDGELGYGHTQRIGDDETPVSAGAVDAGGPVKDVALGQMGTCALLAGGLVRCWGPKHPSTGWHEEDTGKNHAIGDDEIAAKGRIIDLPGPAVQIEAGHWHMCARLQDQRVYCWGESERGQLGRNFTTNSVSKKDEPTTPGPISINERFKELSLGQHRSCAVTTNGAVYCWGEGLFTHQTASGSTSTPIYLAEVPRRIDLPGPADSLTNGSNHSCAVLDDGLYCWGESSLGALGYPTRRDIGQNEVMGNMGPVPIFGGQGPGIVISPETYDGQADYKLSFRWPFGAPPKTLSPGQELRFQGTYEQIMREDAADIGRITVGDELVMLWFDSEGSPTQYPTRPELSTWGMNAYEWAAPFSLRAVAPPSCAPLEVDEDVEISEEHRDKLQGRRLSLRAYGTKDVRGGYLFEGSAGTLGGGYFFDVHEFREWRGLEHIENPTVDFGYHENHRRYNIIRRDCGMECEIEFPILDCESGISASSHIYGGFVTKPGLSDESFDPVFDIDCQVLDVSAKNDRPDTAYSIGLDCIGITQRRRFPKE